MPLARDFLETFGQSSLAGEPWVLTGNILTYARDHHGIPVQDFFDSGLDIEALHSEVESKLIDALARSRTDRNAWLEAISLHGTYVQLVFIFAATVNLIQNGPVSKPHKNLAATLTSSDAAISFNWDTLMDRALAESMTWTCDNGYGFQPYRVYRNGWELPGTPEEGTAAPSIVKLHGSSNWITSYPGIDQETRTLSLMQTAPADRVSVYECTLDPYSTYDGRYMAGYERYSYGYYPPNVPDDTGKSAREGHKFIVAKYRFPWMPKGRASDKGLVSSPLIIPPVQNKTYALFGSLFTSLWAKAQTALERADEIAIVGYSFPVTDVQSVELFKKAFCKRSTAPLITICNPTPNRALEILCRQCGIPASNVRVFSNREGYFNETFDCRDLWKR